MRGMSISEIHIIYVCVCDLALFSQFWISMGTLMPRKMQKPSIRIVRIEPLIIRQNTSHWLVLLHYWQLDATGL